MSSLAEKIHVPINGMQQGMFVESKDTRQPVLLLLHGGPGLPTHFLTQQYPTGLEEEFTVCWWEQRGAGLSYRPGIPPETMTVAQLIADTHAVTDYLRGRFGQPKIHLMGHSWGSFLGIQAAAQAPERYHAYIGVAQVSHQLRSEKVAYDYMLAQFRTNGNRRMVRKLEAAPVTLAGALPAAYVAVRDEAMHTLGIGTTRDMRSVVTGIFLRSWLSREYTFGEKLNLWRGKRFSKALLWDDLIATDLTQTVTALDLPVYFFHGRYDYTVSYAEAKAYLAQISAPVKGFYTFAHSAHSPLHEEPEKLRRLLREDVLWGDNRLADEEPETLDTAQCARQSAGAETEVVA
jgi:pimeloyl-ACP methyl ester carboxylesterase